MMAARTKGGSAPRGATEPTWHQLKAAETDKKLRDAMKRLLKGEPMHGKSDLTVTNLADEAGVGRATAYRRAEVIADFEMAVRELQAVPDPQNLNERVRRAEDALRDAKKQAATRERELTEQVELYAQQIQHLVLRLRNAEANATRGEEGYVDLGVINLTRRRAKKTADAEQRNVP